MVMGRRGEKWKGSSTRSSRGPPRLPEPTDEFVDEIVINISVNGEVFAQ